MRRSLISFILCFQFLMLPSYCFTQQQTTPKPKVDNPPRQSTSPQEPERVADIDVVKISTNLVQVDAVVTDKRGKRITDLRSDELEILEDGKSQKITNFSYVALDSTQPVVPTAPAVANAPPAPPIRLKADQVHRTTAFVVDDLGLSFESIYSVRQALKKYVDRQMQPDDLVAIIRTGGGIGALQQFTSDKRQLYAAIDRVKWNPIGRGGIGAFAPMGRDPSVPASPNTNDSTSGNTEDKTSASEDLDQFRQDVFAAGTLGALAYVVRGLRELPGRKSVILLSDGLQIFSRSDPTGSARILSALRHLTDLANRASVVIYTMDARGLQTLGLTAADSTADKTSEQVEESLTNRRNDFFESQSGLNYLAQQTGGFSIRNTNDLNSGIKRVIEDQSGYYLIGYRPDLSTFDRINGRGKFHKISLKVKRPGKFNVRVRNGFFGISDDQITAIKQTPNQQMISALTSPFGFADVHLRLTSLFGNDPKLGSIMRSYLHVSGHDLTFTDEPDGWHKAVFDLMAVTFGDNGIVVDQLNRIHTMRVRGATYERIRDSGFIYNLAVPAKKPGAYQLRTALRDEGSSRVGSATQFIEVPDIKKNRLTVSGIFLKGTPLNVYIKSLEKASSAQGADDTAEDADPKANTAVRQFRRGMAMEYGLNVYNAQIDKATSKPLVKTQVRIFRDGQLIFSGNEIPLDLVNQPDLKRLAIFGAIQLGTSMLPGEYIFQVVVTDTLAKEKRRMVTQWMDFEITD